MYPYILQKDSLTIAIDNKQQTINRGTHPNFQKVIDAIIVGEWDKIQDLIDITRAIKDYTSENGDIEVRDGDVYFQNRPFANALTDRLLTMLEEGFPVEPLCNFLSNLKDNPSKRAVDELYGFLEKNKLPITPDGHFLAYKKVRDNYKDIHSGTIDNSIGQICEMPRNEVAEDKDITCSSGLHFCSLEYLPKFGSYDNNRVVILKINPRDVVSIPSDYNNAKGRCCRYEIVDEHDVENRDTTEAFDSVVVDNYSGPREVVNADGRWRYLDTGRYASKEAARAWLEYKGKDNNLL